MQIRHFIVNSGSPACIKKGGVNVTSDDERYSASQICEQSMSDADEDYTT